MPNPNFRADQAWVQPGQCATLRWDVDGIQAIYFFDGKNETGVTGHDARQVCPTENNTYGLRIVNQAGGHEYYEVMVSVGNPATAIPLIPVINFWADAARIQPGQCTTLRWQVMEVNAVYLNTGHGDEGVVGQGERQVCPATTWTYTLRIVHRDGQQEVRPLTVNVGNVDDSDNPRVVVLPQP